MKLQKKQHQRNPSVWEWPDLYTIATSSYAAELPVEQLTEAVAVVNYDIKRYKKLRRAKRRKTRGYWYLSMCMEEMQSFLANVKARLAKQAAPPGPAGT